jgi:hypothetical protein
MRARFGFLARSEVFGKAALGKAAAPDKHTMLTGSLD